MKNIDSELYDKNFLNYVYKNFISITWRGPLLSLNDLLERIITVQDFECLKFVFYNYQNKIKLIEILFFEISRFSYYSDEYRERYLRVINTFNYLRFSGKLWPKEYRPKLLMKEMDDYLDNLQKK